jgi:hypothetical protein
MSYVPNELYAVYVWDNSGTLQFIAEYVTRIEYKQRINAPWNHQITVEMSVDNPAAEIYRNLETQRDWFITINRIDPVTLVNTEVYYGFNMTVVDQIRVSGDLIFNLYGVGFTQLLNRRITLPTAGEEYSTKTGAAETVMKEYVSESMVSPIDADRIFTGVSVEADAGTGETVTYEARYTNLASVVGTVSEKGNINYGLIKGSTLGEYIFRVKPTWGLDKTLGNTDGNTPVVFSILYDNMLIPILSINASEEQNYAYVGGDGQGANRIIQEEFDADAIALSPWSRKEVFVEARQQSSTDALIATGQRELRNRRSKQTLSFNIQQTIQSRWIRDWELGDLVTAQYFNFTFTKQIVEIGVQVTSSASARTTEVIQVELEDA